MADNSDSNKFLIFVGCLFLLFFVYMHRQNKLLDEKYKNVVLRKASTTKTSSEKDDLFLNSKPYSKLNVNLKPQIQVVEQPSIDVFLKERSQTAIEGFKTEAFLEIIPPTTFDYIKLDLDEGMTGIHGYDPISEAKVTGLALAQNIAPENVIELLKKNSDYVPNLSKAKIAKVDAGLSLPSPNKSSGLSGGTLWNGKLSNGEDFAAVFLQRQDKKGVYFLILSGTPDYFSNNDGAFDKLYDSVKAKSPTP